MPEEASAIDVYYDMDIAQICNISINQETQ